jgi:hypothetical protein
MSVPLDRLYQFIESTISEVYGNVIIYQFWPHGSKKLDNLIKLHHDMDWCDTMLVPAVICNDQEPLNYEFYQNHPAHQLNYFVELAQRYDCNVPTNLERHSIFDKNVVLHSEKNSPELDKYAGDDRFIPAYYWSHAVISLDWFRYAKHVNQNKIVEKNFLIYNRAWAGTREYRIKFTELLIKHDLVPHCKTTFNPEDPDTKVHYTHHEFKNSVWKSDLNLHGVFPTNELNSCASADFVLGDYEHCDIEVVLETLFDDLRVHLTEKILRPIACAQPFILVSPPASLQYLKDYGFLTYDTVWDESYDNITDPALRLQNIIELMKTIANWDPKTKMQKMIQARAIAEHNKKHFFSDDFFNLVLTELKTNIKTALVEVVQTNTSSRFLQYRKEYAQHHELKQIINGRVPHPNVKHLPSGDIEKQTYFNTDKIMTVLKQARKYYDNASGQTRNE